MMGQELIVHFGIAVMSCKAENEGVKCKKGACTTTKISTYIISTTNQSQHITYMSCTYLAGAEVGIGQLSTRDAKKRRHGHKP
jgi:hypothetical protein